MSEQQAENDVSSETFDTAASGASVTVPTQCSALRKNGHVLIKGHPCKIVELSTSKTGKHGHAKVKLTGLDIFTGKKYEDVCPSTHNMNVPNVARKEYMVISVDSEGYLSVIDDNGEEREDLKISENTTPNDIEAVEKLIEDAGSGNLTATVIKAMDTEGVMSFKKN